MFNRLYRIKKQTYKDLVEATKNTIHFLEYKDEIRKTINFLTDIVHDIRKQENLC